METLGFFLQSSPQPLRTSSVTQFRNMSQSRKRKKGALTKAEWEKLLFDEDEDELAADSDSEKDMFGEQEEGEEEEGRRRRRRGW